MGEPVGQDVTVCTILPNKRIGTMGLKKPCFLQTGSPVRTIYGGKTVGAGPL